MILSKETDAKILNKVQSYWQSTVRSQAWKEWFFTAVKCERYKSGSFYGDDGKTLSNMTMAQFENELNSGKEDYEPISLRRDSKISVNLIDAYVNSLVGEQLKTKTSVSVRAGELASDLSNLPSPLSGSQEDLDLSVKAYNAQLYKKYEQCNVLYYQGRGLEDMLVYGMSGGFFDVVDGNWSYSRINPLYIVPDLRDETVGFDDSEFVGQLIPMSVKKAFHLFPKMREILDKKSLEETILQFISPARLMYMSGATDIVTNGSIVFVKMVEWKEWETSYSGVAQNGRQFTVFDEEMAEQFAYSKKLITEGKSERIHRAYYAGDVLLHYACLDFSQPREQFSLVLSCLSKKSSAGGFYVPKSMVENLLDIHDAFLVSLSKATYLSISKKIAVNKSILKNHKFSSPRQIKKELASPTTVLLCDDPTRDLVDFSHQQQINIHASLTEEFMRVADRATGINREQQGLQTNANTGIAIKERQVQAITSNIYAFNEFDNFKKKIGRLFLQTLQMQNIGRTDIFYPAHPTQGGYIALNVQNGDKILRDINFLPLDVYIEETPYYLSSKEEQLELLLNLFQSPIAPVLLQIPGLIEKLPIPLDPEIASQIGQFFQAQQQTASQNAQPQPQGLTVQ